MFGRIELISSWMIRVAILCVFLGHKAYCDEVKLTVVPVNGTDSLGGLWVVTCRVNDTAVKDPLWWTNDKNETKPSNVASKGSFHEATLVLQNVSFNDFGTYYCKAKAFDQVHNTSFDLRFNVKRRVELQPEYVVKEGSNVSLVCEVVGYPIAKVIRWTFNNQFLGLENSSDYVITEKRRSLGEITSTLYIIDANLKLEGKYMCNVLDGTNETNVVVQSKPVIKLTVLKAVSKTEVYVSWTLYDGNSKITKLQLQYVRDGSSELNTVKLNLTDTEYLLKNLGTTTSYGNFTIFGENAIGSSTESSPAWVETLDTDPFFVPAVSLKGVTSDSVTLGWNVPPNITEFYTYYNITVQNRRGFSKTYFARANQVDTVKQVTDYMVDKLKPGLVYFFKVQACSNYTKRCDDFSGEVNGTTMDGISSAPLNLEIKCVYNHTTLETMVSASWSDPEDRKGVITEYDVVLYGNASYYDQHGRQAEDKVGPIKRTVLETQPKKVDFRNQPPNTRLYLSVCAKTRARVCGTASEASCETPESIPDTDELSKASWRAVQRSDSQQIFFLVTLPHISQRNGTICCFRVVVVRMQKDQTIKDLPPPHQMEISTYQIVHNGTKTGAYIAEMLDPNSHNTMIGDGTTVVDDKRQLCHRCWPEDYSGKTNGNYRPPEQYNFVESSGTNRHRRHSSSSMQHSMKIPAYDGPLDKDSCYTAFLDVIVSNKHGRMTAQSKYFQTLKPMRVDKQAEIPGEAIIGSLILALIVVLFALMCVMRWRNKGNGEQEYGTFHSFQQCFRRLRGQQPIPSEEPPNLPSILKEQLVTAYLDRHRDSDLGFQQEFEKLPDRFCDRTSSASDHRDNSGKNRYPDIKAYDQTRIKLSTIEGGSDYINANMVVGYKERKKFVCAQGPMDPTVVDWWRMIWEQHVHFILMLTNTEEYNKTKCAKYWPSEGSTNYGDFVVTNGEEKRYSDYLVRNLKLTRTRAGSSQDEGAKDERDIFQYHYLVWKDFMAPEHPVGILRFIKRFNEAYAPDKGPILVHCSAGVGRTGTLVALDSLLQQLNEEDSVSVFNTICDLRHQRNYLVQSLKQYIFIYRALMEMAQFGDTDVVVAELKSHIEKLKGTTDGKTICRMEEEFERLSQVIEDRKPFSVGASDENRHRNRHENVIPYDRSRVHLSPMPGLNKEINTYINATFIEGYDTTEQFIIAQDPLDVTIGDFWRMIVEQNIRSIVMLSETGEEKCPRYWPEKDQETSHDYIKVKYMQSQSFPFYYRREFTVTDTKSDHSCLVTQFQYNGWPMGECEVPQIDRGIVELIVTTFKYTENLDKNVGPTVVHCSDGADRSCIFVALAILVQQMMKEPRVDVFSVVRKLRSQRQGLFRKYAQYEFIYRGLVTYAELHVSNGNSRH